MGLVAAAGCLSGCSSSAGEDPAEGASSLPVVTGLPAEIDYVALGDSFTAGPLIAPYADDAGGCLRSAANYPSLLAERLDVASFTDVSCSGARVSDLLRPQRSFIGGRIAAPQLDAVLRGTDLVTVGIGGNDESLFGSLAGGCSGGETASFAGCDSLFATPGSVAAKVASARRVEPTLTRALARIHRRAPEALVVVVGYPSLLPESGRCAAVPFAAADYAPLNRIEAALNDSLRGAAEAQGARFVDLAAASRGHDICAGDDAWVNGPDNRPDVAAAYHPFASGMVGAADAILRVLAVEQ